MSVTPIRSRLNDRSDAEVQNPNNYNTGPYPDYEDISNNFTVLESLTLLISVFTKSIEKLENLKSADLGAELSNYLDPQQVFGHCICNDCGNTPPEDMAGRTVRSQRVGSECQFKSALNFRNHAERTPANAH